MTSLKPLSLNVRGLSNKKKRKTAFSWIKKQKADIIFLQESHSTKDSEKKWKKERGNDNIYFSHGASNARGSCILFRSNLDCEVKNEIIDSNGRFVLLKVHLNGIPKILLNVYSPNDLSKAVDFFKKLKEIMISELIIGLHLLTCKTKFRMKLYITA